MIFDNPGASERRQTPRYELDLLADLVLDNGNVFSISTNNISSRGLQIICNTWVTDEIEPRGIQSHSISNIRFKVIMAIPVGTTTEKLYTICRIMSVHRLSQDKYMLNLVFVDFENNSESVLNRFLGQHQQRKTVITSFG